MFLSVGMCHLSCLECVVCGKLLSSQETSACVPDRLHKHILYTFFASVFLFSFWFVCFLPNRHQHVYIVQGCLGRRAHCQNNYMTQIIESNYLVCCLFLIAFCCIFLFCLFAWSLSRLHQYYSTTDSE